MVISAVGLLLDLIGVMLLGIDLIRVQRHQRNDAIDRLARLENILEGIGGLDGWAKTVRSDFRDWDWDEGRTVMLDGTFDPRAARESVQEIAETVSVVGTHVVTLAQMQTATIDADRSAADVSLKFAYFGLALILAGFAMQLWPYLSTLL